MQARWAVHRPPGQVALIHQLARGEDRRVMPDLPVRGTLVEPGDQLEAGLEQSRPDRPRRHLGRAGAFQHVERERELQRPDRLEVGREEWPRGAEHVVAVGVVEVAVCITLEHIRRQACEGRVAGHGPEHGRM